METELRSVGTEKRQSEANIEPSSPNKHGQLSVYIGSIYQPLSVRERSSRSSPELSSRERGPDSRKRRKSSLVFIRLRGSFSSRNPEQAR